MRIHNSMLMHVTALLLMAIIVAGCGEIPAATVLVEEEDTIPVDTITAVDSIGILMGDSCYTLGAISDFTMFPGAQPVILDRVKGTVSVFDSTGVFVRSFGGFGEGPGEFQGPMSLVRLSSGIVLVMDRYARVVSFNSQGEYLNSWNMEGLGGFSIESMPFDDSTFVSYSFSMRRNESGFGINFLMSRCHAVTGEVLTEYFCWSGEPVPSTDFTPGYLVAASDGRGRVYLSRIQSENWMIEVYGADAEALDTISLFPDRERIAAPDTVMIPGTVYIGYAFSDGETQETAYVNMPEEHPFISALGVDGEGNIWCRRGGLPGDMWDVVSPEGEHLREVLVTLPDSAYFIDMDVNPNGVLAFDMMTEDYHKLYIMGSDERN